MQLGLVSQSFRHTAAKEAEIAVKHLTGEKVENINYSTSRAAYTPGPNGGHLD